MLTCISKQSGESIKTVLKTKRKATDLQGFAEKEGFQPGTKK